jgi:hypothetical protein
MVHADLENNAHLKTVTGAFGSVRRAGYQSVGAPSREALTTPKDVEY